MKRVASTVLSLVIPCALASAQDWPEWRGPDRNGVSPEAGLPLTWGKDNNVAWRAPLGGQGISSPIAFGDLVIVTSQIGRGDVRPGNHPTLGQGGAFPEERSMGGALEEGVVFLVEAYDRINGRRLWQYRLPAERTADSLPEVHRKTNLANPSPSTDGKLIYAWFGTGQIVALDFKGTLVWQRHLGKEYGPYAITWGHSSSPTLYGNTLILLCDHNPASYLLALDKRTGKQVWKADRGKGLHSYSTPTVVSGSQGDELVVNSSERIEGYDPKTGERLWFYDEPNQFPIPVPSFGDGVIFTSRGYRSGPYMAIRPGGRGDIAGTKNVVWHVATGAPYVSSVVQYQGVVYLASDAGILQAADAGTGKRLFQGRTGNLYTAAPIAGDGKVYFVSENGETVVLKASREFEILARNHLDGRFMASPIVANGLLLLRSDNELIAIGTASRSNSVTQGKKTPQPGDAGAR
ncbi:MAG: PQQ-binding-like beta-propeller repeat protein [Vicinamibacteria bacterium]|nr:PQQ-binding-like beta-propeller repeat protein [Vicinamibacteria bacterium]